MKPTKRVLKHPCVQAVLCWLMAQYIRLVWWTSHVERHIAPETEALMRGEQQGIFAFWHGRLLMFPVLAPKLRAMHVLISGHNDGVLIARVVTYFGIGTVEGSSSKRSLSSLRELLRILKEGHNISITPDGPRGPFQQAAPGVAYLARSTELPVVPVAWSVRRARRLRSWDRFMIPWPCNRLFFVAMPPISLSEETQDADATHRITQALTEATRRADQLSGRELL